MRELLIDVWDKAASGYEWWVVNGLTLIQSMIETNTLPTFY